MSLKDGCSQSLGGIHNAVNKKLSRGQIMSRIKSKDTKPELEVRRFLHTAGLRYRLHDPRLPGNPDLVFPKWKAIVFVHGCFWHGHGCKRDHLAKSNRNYWQPKIARNKRRDRQAIERLKALGWRTFVVWECEINPQSLKALYQKITSY